MTILSIQVLEVKKVLDNDDCLKTFANAEFLTKYLVAKKASSTFGEKLVSTSNKTTLLLFIQLLGIQFYNKNLETAIQLPFTRSKWSIDAFSGKIKPKVLENKILNKIEELVSFAGLFKVSNAVAKTIYHQPIFF